MAIDQEKLQAFGQLMQLLGNPLQDVSGLVQLQRGFTEDQERAKMSERDAKRLKLETIQAQNDAKAKIAQLNIQKQAADAAIAEARDNKKTNEVNRRIAKQRGKFEAEEAERLGQKGALELEMMNRQLAEGAPPGLLALGNLTASSGATDRLERVLIELFKRFEIPGLPPKETGPATSAGDISTPEARRKVLMNKAGN